jgi:hypothetical protein
MPKVTAGQSVGRSVNAEVETLRLLAVQRRKASLNLFLKRNIVAQPDAAAEKASLSPSARSPTETPGDTGHPEQVAAGGPSARRPRGRGGALAARPRLS